MQWGLVGANVGAFAEPEAAVALAVAAENTGFDSLWTFDHVVVPLEYASRYPYSASGTAPGVATVAMPDSMVWLAYVAAHTSTIALGTGVLILPQRNPLVLAKQAATLDVLSGGRLRLGVGVGWLEEEFDAVGVPFAQRGARADAYIAAMRELWASDAASHESDFASFREVRSLPHPPNGDVHVVIGGHSEAAAMRAGRVGDGWFAAIDAASIRELTLPGALERFVTLIDLMRDTAQEHGRDPAAVEISLLTGMAPPPDAVARLEQEGVHRLVAFVPARSVTGIDNALAAMAQRIGLR